jgi:hypothetical protein
MLRVLTMVYNTELLGFWTLSGILEGGKHDVSETGSVSVVRGGVGPISKNQ